MPGFDGTGPQGMGPMTGGARGYCAMGAGANWRPGFGRGRGMGRGRGFHHWYWATGAPGWARAGWGWPGYTNNPYYPTQVSPEQEVDMLRGEAEALKLELDDVQKRISALENKGGQQ